MMSTYTDAPIRTRALHDAHVLGILMLFFVGIALPVAWHTVVGLSIALAIVARIQGLGWRAIAIRLTLALLLSWSIWVWNMLFAAEHTPDTVHKANQILLRVTTMTWVALMSGAMLNLRDVVSFALQRGWLSMNIAYALQLGFGSIELMRAEIRRIVLSARLRGLSWRERFLQWLPILIFALRHATRGAMSLRARGLRVDSVRKTFYYNYQATNIQKRHAWICLLVLAMIALFSEWFYRA
jgi:energy-coupling factor transporter transmembrane protein EcfT